MLFSSGSLNRFALICTHFASVTDSCCPLRESSHLFDLFLMLCNYLCTVIVYFGFVVEESIHLSVLGSPIFFPFG
jgi:hypothetical protein